MKHWPLWVFLAILVTAAAVRSSDLKMQRLEPTPSCFISHLLWRRVQPLPNGEDALHFLGFLEDGELRVKKFERSIPVWPAQEPHVLFCVQFSPNNGSDSLNESF